MTADVEWCANWLRNNYQDHPTISSLCAAMLAARPAAPQAKAAYSTNDIKRMADECGISYGRKDGQLYPTQQQLRRFALLAGDAALSQAAPVQPAESVRELLIGAAAMAVVAERQGRYQGAAWVADSVLESAAQPAQQPDGGCDLCRNPLFAGTKCKACGRVAAPAQQPDERDEALRVAREFITEVRRSGDTRLASMAIAAIARIDALTTKESGNG